MSEPESLKQELVDFAINWPSFKECDIFSQENDRVYDDNSDELESEPENMQDENQYSEQNYECYHVVSENVVGFESEMNLDYLNSELENTADEDLRVKVEWAEVADKCCAPDNHGLGNEFTSSKTHDTDRDGGCQETVNRRKGCKKSERCNNCPTCVYMFLAKYNMHSAAYKNLYQVYKLALTLPVTQVFCQRTFSELKLLKTRLRSTLSTDHLNSLLLIMVENKLVNSFSSEGIIDNVAQHSSEFRRLLLH